MGLITKNEQSRSEKISFLNKHWDTSHIVVDFDGILTQFFDEEGKKRYAIISLLYQEGILDDDYTARAQDLHDKYYPIEHDKNLDEAIKSQAMDTRWTDHKLLLIEKGLNYKDLEKITSSGKIVMRKGTDVFLHQAYNRDIPLVIFSASGIGYDAIKLLLKHRGLDLPNITIISNKLYRNEQGVVIDFSKPIIHSLNKKESVLWNSSEYIVLQDQLKNKPHALLIGDGIGDAGMIENKPNRIIAKLGLCNDKVEEKTKNYLTYFDAVITNDDGFDSLLDHLEWSVPCPSH